MIVLDEPLASLDASAQAQIANLLAGLARELELGLLLISHDLAIVRHVADVVAVMYLGQIVERAPTKELWATPLHPYSEALIGAVPRADGAGILPEALPGEVPDPSRPPDGCRFHTRCPVRLRPLSLGGAAAGRARAGPVCRVLAAAARRAARAARPQGAAVGAGRTRGVGSKLATE